MTVAVIFEFWVDPEQGERYFELAAEMREEVQKADGFIANERFESLTEEGKYVSLSFWRDEAAVEAWYGNSRHKKAQGEGRARVFKDYRLRVVEVIRDYDLAEGRPRDIAQDTNKADA